MGDYILARPRVIRNGVGMILFILWIGLAVLVGVFASQKGRSGVGYTFLSLVLSPLLGMIILLLAGEDKKAVEEKRVAAGGEVKCYFCAELIKAEAKICRHCGKPNNPFYQGPWLKIGGFGPGSVFEGSPAKAGDGIAEYDGKALKGDLSQLQKAAEEAAGRRVKVTLIRDAEPLTVEIQGGQIGINIGVENPKDAVPSSW